MNCQHSNASVVKLPAVASLGRAATLLVLVPLLPAAAQGQEPFLPDGLVVQWTFNETGGTTAADSAGNLVGDLVTRGGGGALPTFVEGRFGNALFVDGVGGNNDTPGMEARTGDFSVIDFSTTTDFSFAYWLKSDPSYDIGGPDDNTAETIIAGLYGPDGTFSGEAFQFTATRTGGFNGHYLRYGAPASPDIQPGEEIDGPALVTDDSWHHYAWTVDRDGESIMYIDAEEVGRFAYESTLIDYVGATGINVMGDQYAGSIDDLRIYNRVLTAADVLVLAPQEPIFEYSWNSTEEADWNAAGSWTPARGAPPNGNFGAIFGSVILSATTVVVDSDVSVRAIDFDNANSYAIAGVASVSLIAGTVEGVPVPTRIDVQQGSHQFQAVVNLQTDTSSDVAGGSTLIFNNQLNLGGNTLTKTGGGELAFRNDSATGTGTVNIQEGTLSGGGTVGGSVENSGGGVAPGNSPGMLTINENYTQNSGSLEIELGGLLQADEYDVLNVIGDIVLNGGDLNVTLIDSFEPANGDSFDILDFSSLTGEFDNVSLPGGFSWDQSQLYTEGILRISGGFAADFDADGDVDGDDFLLWQVGFGISSGAIKMDGDYDNDGDVDGDDFLGWRVEFPSPGSGSGSGAVPEPASIMLLLSAAAIAALGRQRATG